MLRIAALALVALSLAGCGVDLTPLDEEAAVAAAGRPGLEDRRLHVQLVRSFDRMPPDVVLKHVISPNERLACAAVTSLGRAHVRRDAEASAVVLAALGQVYAREERPSVQAAIHATMANLQANRSADAALPAEPPAVRPTADKPLGRAMTDLLGSALADARTTRNGPGWKVPTPAALPPRLPAPEYFQPVHTVPVVSQGLLRVGDVTGDGAADYLVFDTPAAAGPDQLAAPDAVHVRMSLYDHDGQMLWSIPLVGDDRPIAVPERALLDLDGTGSAKIVFGDRGGRIVIHGASGQLLARSDPLRMLNGDPFLPGARMLSANLRGGGSGDFVLALGREVLAVTDTFEVLWHVQLEHFDNQAPPTTLADLDGDGRNEILHGQVCLGPDGAVLWTWPGEVAAHSSGRLVAGHDFGVAVLGGEWGLAAFDIDGPLWYRDTPIDVTALASGRFTSASGGVAVGVGDGMLLADALDGLGRPLGEQGEAVRPLRFLPPGMVADWNRDGRDELWAVQAGASASVPGWFALPSRKSAIHIAFDGLLGGLADVNNDGRDELLYFQGKSLVIQRR